MNGLLTIGWNTFRELLRQPVFLAITVGLLVLNGLLANVSYFGFGEEARLVKTTSLSILLLSGLATASIGASSALSKEVQTGTALSVLAKPVGRITFLLAKYCGVVVSLVAQTSLGLLSTLVASRMAFDAYGGADWVAISIYFGSIALAFVIGLASNYFTHRPLMADASFALGGTFLTGFLLINLLDHHGAWQKFGAGVDWRLVPACALILLALLVLAGIALACSTRMNLLPTVVVCSLLLLAGLLSDYLFGASMDGGFGIAAVLHALLPNWQHFWLADAIAGQNSIPLGYLAKAAAYAVIYAGFSLGIGTFLFEDRELH